MHRAIKLIVIHCSASPNGVSLFEGKAGESNFRSPVEVMDGWHARRGFRRALSWRLRLNEPLTAIGYHFIVYTAGTIVTGRHVDEIGAHVAGNNRESIGVCVIGTDAFSAAQWKALADLVRILEAKYPSARVCGHRDLSPDQDNDGLVEPWEWLKTCPGFDVAAWRARGMEPDPKHVFNASLKEPSR